MTMQIYRDQDADLSILENRQIAVIGYGNQGRSQALNLRDSGLAVIVGNQDDEYAACAAEDGFAVLPIAQAVAQADVVMMLIPDEVMPGLFVQEITRNLKKGSALVFASGYTIAFDLISPPTNVDVILVAPRMIGAGVRDLYSSGRGFSAFFAIHQDYTGQAKGLVLALAEGIGATRMGAVEVTFEQETELDLFTEQCFGPAFGKVLTTAVDLLLEEGYPPEAVLLELYMSGELAYTLAKIAAMGTVEQTALHSTTSQYGSMSRGMRFMLPGLHERMQEGLDEIRSGAFAREWAAEQALGSPTLEGLRSMARTLPLHRLEQELRQALGDQHNAHEVLAHQIELPSSAPVSNEPTTPFGTKEQPQEAAFSRRLVNRLRAVVKRPRDSAHPSTIAGTLNRTEMENVLGTFFAYASDDPALQAFAANQALTTHYLLSDPDLEFYLEFNAGMVKGSLGAPPTEAEVRLKTGAEMLDKMLTGRANAMSAAMTGRLSFEGNARLALSVQQIQSDLIRHYTQARRDTLKDSVGTKIWR